MSVTKVKVSMREVCVNVGVLAAAPCIAAGDSPVMNKGYIVTRVTIATRIISHNIVLKEHKRVTTRHSSTGNCNKGVDIDVNIIQENSRQTKQNYCGNDLNTTISILYAHHVYKFTYLYIS